MRVRCFWVCAIAVAVIAAPAALQAQTPMGTAFTYQGQLRQAGEPFDGTADFEFTLWDAAVGGTQIAGPESESGVEVVNGLFTVTTLDFGEGVFAGAARWLEIAVNGTTLSPRQELTPAPCALALPGLWTRQNTTSPNLIGGYSANSVTAGVVGATIGGGGRNAYENRVLENFGTVAGGLDNVASGIAAIGGGNHNTASGNAATVAGGYTNTASGWMTTVGGGYVNTASGEGSLVPGGAYNQAGGSYSFAAGRRAKVRDPDASGDEDGDEGTFVWADYTNLGEDFTSTGPNQFLIRASGGVGIGTTDPQAELDVAGDVHVSGTVTKSYTAGTRDRAIPIAYGFIRSSGTIASGTPNISCTYDTSYNRYVITIADESYYYSDYVTVVTPASSSPTFASTDSLGGNLLVFMKDVSGNDVYRHFQFVTYKPGDPGVSALESPRAHPTSENPGITDAEALEQATEWPAPTREQ